MGTWGSSLYANDCTCDVRDTYMKYLKEQFSNEDAYKETLKVFQEYIGSEEEPLFWYALADTQWRVGRLMPYVKEKALTCINMSGGISLFKKSKNGGYGWKKTLIKLKKRLETSMPSEKTIKKPIEFVHNPWNIGDIYVYQFHSEQSKKLNLYGGYIAFQKIADQEWCDNLIFSRIQIYDKVFDHVPNLDSLDGVRILPFDTPERFISNTVDVFPLNMNAVLIRYSKRDYPQKYLTFIGNQQDNKKLPHAHPNLSNYDWRNLEEEWLCLYYQAWRKYEYEIRDGEAYVHLTSN